MISSAFITVDKRWAMTSVVLTRAAASSWAWMAFSVRASRGVEVASSKIRISAGS